MTTELASGNVATPPCTNAMSTPDFRSSSSRMFSPAPSVIRSSSVTPCWASTAL